MSKIKLDFKNKICDAALYGNSFYLLDEKLRLYKLTKEFKLDKSYSLIDKETDSFEKLLLKQAHIFYAKDETPFAYEIKTKNYIKYSWLGKKLNCVSQSPGGELIATGYNNGKVDIFHISGNIFQSLFFDVGDIFFIDFDKNYNRILSIGTKNKIVIHDVELSQTRAIIRHDIKILKAKFLDENEIFCLHADGSTSIININKEQIIKKNDNSLKNIISFELSSDRKYALLGDKNGELIAISVRFNKVLFRKKYENLVHKIKWIKKTMILFFEDGSVEIYPLENAHQDIKDEIVQKNYQKAYEILQENSFLALFEDIENEFDKAWNEEIFPQVLDLILNGNEKEAKYLSKPFIHDIYKKKLLNLYTDKKELIQQFVDANENKEYNTIYDIVQNYPHLEKTTIFKTIEDEWNVLYKQAKSAMRKDFKQKATEILTPFNNVNTKKNLISFLTNFPKPLFEAEKLLILKQYDEYFMLVTKNKVLKDTPEYQKTINELNDVVQKIDKNLKAGRFRNVIVLAKKLYLFKPFKAMAKGYIKEVKNKVEFLNKLNAQDIKGALEIVENDYNIVFLDTFREFLKPFKQKQTQAYEHIEKSNVEHLLLVFNEYINYPILKDKIASFVKLAYLKKFLSVNEEDIALIDWRRSFEHYSLYFGTDEDLKLVAKNKNIERELYKVIGKNDFFGYKKYEFSEDILKYKTKEQIEEEERRKRQRSEHPHYLHMAIVAGGVVVFILLTWMLLTVFDSNIEQIKQERKRGPYKGFKKVYETIKSGIVGESQ